MTTSIITMNGSVKALRNDATPVKIHRKMGVSRLSRKQISSHLQRYRKLLYKSNSSSFRYEAGRHLPLELPQHLQDERTKLGIGTPPLPVPVSSSNKNFSSGRQSSYIASLSSTSRSKSSPNLTTKEDSCSSPSSSSISLLCTGQLTSLTVFEFSVWIHLRLFCV